MIQLLPKRRTSTLGIDYVDIFVHFLLLSLPVQLLCGS